MKALGNRIQVARLMNSDTQADNQITISSNHNPNDFYLTSEEAINE